MSILHISLTARDAPALARFYREALGFTERRRPTRLTGAKVWRGNGLPGVDLTAWWLDPPGARGAFLEILAYDVTLSRPLSGVNEPGFGHLALAVPDLDAAVEQVLRHGGSRQGEVTDFGTPETPCRLIYLRDPEGNLLELEQPDAAANPGE